MKSSHHDVGLGHSFPLSISSLSSCCLSSTATESPQPKLTVGESSGRPAKVRKVGADEAVSFIKLVREAFKDGSETYAEFLKLLQDLKTERDDGFSINYTDFVLRLKDLFKGHPNLILGMNQFLPKGCSITLNDDLPEEMIANKFIDKIQARFQNEKHVYISFLTIMDNYSKQKKISIHEVYQKIRSLFQGHDDLIEEFENLRPNDSEMALQQHAPMGRNLAGNLSCLAERSLTMSMPWQVHREKKERAVNFHANHDLSIPCLDANDESVMKFDKEGRKRKRDDKHLECEGNRESGNMQSFPHKRLSAWVGDDFVAEKLPLRAKGAASLGNKVHVARQMSVEEGDNKRECQRDDREKEKGHGTERDKELEQFAKKGARDFGLSLPRAPVLPNLEKDMTKPISGLDLLNYERCHPSYRHLPKNHRKEINEETRYEMDMLLRWIKETIKRAKSLLERINSTIKEDHPIHLEEHFNVQSLRCIERLYGDYGLDMLDVLRKNNVVKLEAQQLQSLQEIVSQQLSLLSEIVDKFTIFYGKCDQLLRHLLTPSATTAISAPGLRFEISGAFILVVLLGFSIFLGLVWMLALVGNGYMFVIESDFVIV